MPENSLSSNVPSYVVVAFQVLEWARQIRDGFYIDPDATVKTVKRVGRVFEEEEFVLYQAALKSLSTFITERMKAQQQIDRIATGQFMPQIPIGQLYPVAGGPHLMLVPPQTDDPENPEGPDAT